MIPPCNKGEQATLPHPQLTEIPDEIGKCIEQYALLVNDLGWENFFRERQGRGDFLYLGGVDHPAHRLLRHYQHRRVPVV